MLARMTEVRFALVAATTFLSGFSQTADQRQEILMNEIERTVVLSQAYMARWSIPAPVSSYNRYYAWSDGGRTVEAVYVGLENQPGRRWVRLKDLPLVLDGGCGFIRVRYDVRAKRVREVICNGG